MKLGNMQGLCARLEARFPSLWKSRFHLVAFILMFLIFFAINQLLLKLPETLRQTLNASPLAHHVAYSDAVIHIFPPKLEIKDVVFVDPALRNVALRFDKLTIRPELWRFFTGKAAMRVTALTGAGVATLDGLTGGSFDFSSASFTLDMENMPLPILEALEQFAPDAVRLLIPRDCDLAANGRIILAPAHNGLAALTFERVRMNSADQSCYAALSGRTLINRRNVADSELNLTVEVKTGPEHITPALLMNDEVRQRLEQGKSLPFALQGTLRNVRMRPVF